MAGIMVHHHDTGEENLQVIVDALQEAGVLRFVRVLLEERQPIAEKVIKKMDSEPTKRGIKNAVTLMMGLGALPDDFAPLMVDVLQQGIQRAQSASHDPEAEKMSIWQLMGMLKDPDVARAIHYLMGFLPGLGKALQS